MAGSAPASIGASGQRRRTRGLALAALIVACLGGAHLSGADREYQVRGMVLQVAPASRTFTVSHEKIDGFMDAMTMPFEVREAKELDGLAPGAIVTFTLVVGERAAYARRIQGSAESGTTR